MIPKEVIDISIRSATKSEVEAFLKDVSAAIDSELYTFAKRDKNMKTLNSLGIMIEDAMEYVKDLTFNDYHAGPKDHHKGSHIDKVWEFKTIIMTHMIYIKLQILYIHDKSLTVISFHIDGM